MGELPASALTVQMAVSMQLPAGRDPFPALGSGAHTSSLVPPATPPPGPAEMAQSAAWFAHIAGVQPPSYLISEPADVQPTSSVLAPQALRKTASDEMSAAFSERMSMGEPPCRLYLGAPALRGHGIGSTAAAGPSRAQR